MNATKKLRPDRPKFYATSAKKLMPPAPTANKLVQPGKLCVSFYATEALLGRRPSLNYLVSRAASLDAYLEAA